MKLKILIVDNKIPFLDSAIQYLNFNEKVELLGWALTRSEAIEKAKKFKPDLILIDLSLPDGNGLDIIKEIKKENRNQKIVVLALHDDSGYQSEAKSSGADGFISKIEFVSKFPSLIENLFPQNNADF